MPRQEQKISSTGIYHILHRGINRTSGTVPLVCYKLVGISLFAVLLLIAVGCSCMNTKTNSSSSSAIPVGSELAGNSNNSSMSSPETIGSSQNNPGGVNQDGGSNIGIGDNRDTSDSGQETPIDNVTDLIGEWDYTFQDPNGNWVYVLRFSADGTIETFSAPQGGGADIGFKGNFSVSNGRILYDGKMGGYGLDPYKVSGTFLASITHDGYLILREDDAAGLFAENVAKDAQYVKVQDSQS